MRFGFSKLLSVLAFFCLCCVPALSAAEQELPASASDAGNAESAENAEKNGANIALGLAESQFTNGVLYAVNRYIAQTEFSGVTLDSIEMNLTSAWQWDQSLFRTNMLGHPYQGVLYYQAGRANNWNFYGSALNAALGSAVWEVFCERSRASVNDLIVTTTGGVVLGEALHRLYYAASSLPAPLRFLISPFDFLNPYLPGERTNRPSGELWRLDAATGLGFAQSDRNNPVTDDSRGSYSLAGFLVLNMVYSDPFSTYVPFSDPFRQFEMNISADIGYPVYQLSIFTDGFLYAVPVLDSERRKSVMGLTLHYDCVLGDTVSFGGTSLDFGWKYRRIAESFNWDFKLHAGWLMFGAANTYFPEPDDDGWAKDQFQLYGTGANVKFSAGITESWAGDFLLAGSLYFMPLIEAGYSEWGDVMFYWQVGLFYTYDITESVFLSFSSVHSFSYEVFRARRDIVERQSVIRLGVGWKTGKAKN